MAVGLGLLELDEVGLEWEEDPCSSRHGAGFDTIRTDVSTYPKDRFTGIEGIWMSPPCPDWSAAGTRTGRDGFSGWLVDQPLEWVASLRPRWLACEQVPGAEAVWKEHALHLQDLGYHTWVGCLSSEEYGVPQTRNRAYLMAHLDHPVGPPPPTHQPYEPGVPAQHVDTWMGSLRPWVSMADALGWQGKIGFPRLDDTGTSEDGYRERDWRDADEPAFNLTAKARSWTLVPGSWADGRGGNRRTYGADEPAPTLHFGHDSSAWVWRSANPLAQPDWPQNRPATTIQGDSRVFNPGGHLSNDGRNNELMSGRSEGIKLTVAEALSLQSMPSNYPMQGSRTSRFAQVGDLVCPFMAAAIVGELLGLGWRDAVDTVTGGR